MTVAGALVLPSEPGSECCEISPKLDLQKRLSWGLRSFASSCPAWSRTTVSEDGALQERSCRRSSSSSVL